MTCTASGTVSQAVGSGYHVPTVLPSPQPWSDEERLGAWQAVRASEAAEDSSGGVVEGEVVSPWSTSVSVHLALHGPPQGSAPTEARHWH